MPAYVTDVPVRWSDQDAYGHVNHACVVTLLEEARAGLMLEATARDGVAPFETPLLVAALDARYRRPIPWSTAGVRIEMVVEELRAASFRVRYRLLVADGAGWDTDKPAVDATTQLVPYDLVAERPRRLTADERTFLADFEAS